MNLFYTPNDKDCIGASDSESIQNAVNAAKKSGVNKVKIPAYSECSGKNEWVIDKAIVLPSDITVILDNCYMVQATGCFDNVFRNENMYTDNDSEQTDIVIKGIGNATIDGGVPNELTEHTSCTNGLPYIRWNNMILLYNVNRFRIEGIKLINQRWWAINVIFASNGYIGNLYIDAKDNIENQDGIDIRLGCHDIIIENIYGQAGDDMIALSGFTGGDVSHGIKMLDKDIDIYNITIRNIHATSVSKAVIALRNQDGIKLHDVVIDNVCDTSGGDNAPYACIRIGQKYYCAKRFHVMGEIYAISVSNVHTNSNVAVMINMTLEKSSFNGIYAGNGTHRVITSDSDWQRGGAQLRDVVFENIFYNCTDNENGKVFEFVDTGDGEFLENVLVRNVFAGNCKTVADIKCSGELRM